MDSMALHTPPEEKIEELNKQLNQLRQERDQLNLEAKKWVEKRDQSNHQIKQLQTEAKAIKAKRDEINLHVQILKAAREKAKTKRQEKHEQAVKLMEKMKPLADRKSANRYQELEKRIQDIDWTIQTSSLPVQEEKELVEKVKELETQKTSHKRFLKLKDKLVEAEIEAKAFGTQARLKHDELSELAKQSQDAHTRFLDVVNRIKPLRQSADEAHQKHLELRQKANTTHEKYVETQRQIKALNEELADKEKQQYAKKGQALKDEAKAKAREKMKRGEKLTFDEFKLLSEEDATQH
jgi:uncharacterized coiled-coil DUF342 family protein